MKLLTIGHSTHDFAQFLGLLNQHEIQVVADVRSRPLTIPAKSVNGQCAGNLLRRTEW